MTTNHSPENVKQGALRALLKGGHDVPLQWRKRKRRKPRKAQLEFRDRNLEEKDADPVQV